MPNPDRADLIPAGFVVFSSDGSVQFGWLNPETNEFCAEADGRHIPNAVGAIPWVADHMH
ncbi:TPA: hypothetical protein QDB15_006246 [Burkholderia vietnamiensis]|jgi:hypothetical protein|uniref:Uncharacterized protein n=1 Tax=Burkholderia vietnamiensis TaxID=60552 RepID=A0AA44XWG1_BURVI|nr:hypothetical protein [Burkholderia vietnamiensis]MBR7912081.1 hypothetical protein [Burkholderia vietnamiensis]MBR7917112.1 hypothetical protein [Burkholderia vietnamiensis]MBR7974440.1 hypothetical protein [Burkholderia vietnamiensis]MBR8001737.1 hypothetical protein [Burkholderia vietnamiensis]MBR8014849.1 hypothetical protein [Burkholderia vietnamiensis]